MLYLSYVLLRYVLIYKLKVSFNFHSTFLQLNVSKMFTVQEKLFFTLLSVIFFKLPLTRTPDNSNLFSISVEGSSYRESPVLYVTEYVLHAQGINVSDAHSENAFSLFSSM